LIPYAGAALELKLSAVERDENISASLKYKTKCINGSFTGSLPLHTKIFELGSKDNEAKERIKFAFDVVAKPLKNEDLYLGIKADYQLVDSNERTNYDVKVVAATKNETFEGGIYARKGFCDKKGHLNKLGAFATTEVNNLVGGSHFSFDIAKSEDENKGFAFETFVGYTSSSSTKYLASFHVVPHSTVSFGVEKQINPNAKISFGFANVVAVGKVAEHLKRTAFNFGLELHH